MTTSVAKATQSQKNERTLLLNLLFSHKRELIAEHIGRLNLNISVSRWRSVPDIRKQVETLLDSQKLSLNDLAHILNQMEGWGKQQIYLYQYCGDDKANWLNPTWVEGRFKQLNKQDIYNKTRPIALPDTPTLASVEHDTSQHRIRFIWVEKRTRLEREEKSDPPPDTNDFMSGKASSLERIIYQAYREITTRGLIFFDWDIKNDEAMLMVHKMTGTDYAQVREARLSELDVVVPKQDFRLLPVSSIVTRLQYTDEVVRRELTFQTVNGEGTLSVSSGNQDDVFADAVLEQARNQFIDSVTGLKGSVRWKTENKKAISLDLYGKLAEDQRIGIAAQELEEDIRYVLRRIRTYCT